MTECRRPACHDDIDHRLVTLILGNGTIDRVCGPFCTRHTNQLLAAIDTHYRNGQPAYKITEGAT